jgi:predicted nucleotidyltransferase
MGQISRKLDKIMEIFYENPSASFTVRELTSKTGVPKSTVHNYLSELKKEGLVTDDNRAYESPLFKIKKTHYFVEKLYRCGLVNEIKVKLSPSCIILFGSFRKGESEKQSDIDIFVESAKKDINLAAYEKKLGHKIQLFIEDDINKLPERLFNNIINGIKLEGYFKVK